jgi:SAM-dependent methyltransferase
MKPLTIVPPSSMAVKGQNQDHWFMSDLQFDQLYPDYIQRLASTHWTPLQVTKMAAEFLVTGEGSRILDIGSGVGKFCLSAGYFKPRAFFVGIEQRKNLVEHANAARNILGLFNTHFIHGDFTQLDFKKYDHFYFYNSFSENLAGTARIDNSIEHSPALYNYYSSYLYKELDSKPAGTKIVTYYGWQDEIPPSYDVVRNEPSGLLKFYVKM